MSQRFNVPSIIVPSGNDGDAPSHHRPTGPALQQRVYDPVVVPVQDHPNVHLASESHPNMYAPRSADEGAAFLFIPVEYLFGGRGRASDGRGINAFVPWQSPTTPRSRSPCVGKSNAVKRALPRAPHAGGGTIEVLLSICLPSSGYMCWSVIVAVTLLMLPLPFQSHTVLLMAQGQSS